jgi:hypothetical protein
MQHLATVKELDSCQIEVKRHGCREDRRKCRSAPNPRSFPNSHLIITLLMQKVQRRAAALFRKIPSKTDRVKIDCFKGG